MSTRVAGFIVGLLLAVALLGLWIMFTRGSEESFDLDVTAETAAADRGLIGSAIASVAERLADERRVVRPVRGDLRFRIANLSWEDVAGPAFVRAAELRGRLDTRAIARGDVVVRGVSIRDADVHVEQNVAREWNYRRVLDRLIGERGEDGPERTFIAFDVAIQNADVRVVRPNQSFSLLDVAAQLPRVHLAGPQLAAPRVVLARATGTLVAADSTYPLALQDALLEFQTGQLNFEVASITTGETRVLDFSGAWGSNFPGYGLIGEGRVENLRFEDVRFVSARLPSSGNAAFAFAVRPIAGETTEVRLSDARINAEGSRVSGSATIRFGGGAFSLEAIDARFDPLNLALVEQLMGDTLPYRGTISGTAEGSGGVVSFDGSTRLTSTETGEPLIAAVTGRVRIAADGFELRRLEATLRTAPLATLRAMVPGLPLKGTISGRITLTGPPGRAPLTVNVRTELAGGIAVVEGRLDLTGDVPRYDLRGRLIAINLQRLLEPDAPPVFMSTRFSIEGAGVDPNTLNARVHADGRFTGWRTGPNDTIHVVARVQNGTVFIDSAGLRLATMSATASGRWRFAAPASGAIEYAIAFDPITPFGPYIPLIGDEAAAGTLRLEGTVSGQAGGIAIGGAARASSFAVGAWSASSLEARYQLVIGPALPELTLEASARELRTPTAGTYETARANVRLVSPLFALDVRAARANGADGLEIVADGRIPVTGAREVVLQRARIDIGQQNWALLRPAFFSWEGARTNLFVRGFELRRTDDKGLLRLEGRLLPLENADFRVETLALPVGDVQRLFGIRPL
ncbi:MAG: hypothetical protein ACT443_10120, partial [Gemmatimonadota bacterium]